MSKPLNWDPDESFREITTDTLEEIYAKLVHLGERQDRIVECLQEIENIFKTIGADIANIGRRDLVPEEEEINLSTENSYECPKAPPGEKDGFEKSHCLCYSPKEECRCCYCGKYK